MEYRKLNGTEYRVLKIEKILSFAREQGVQAKFYEKIVLNNAEIRRETN